MDLEEFAVYVAAKISELIKWADDVHPFVGAFKDVTLWNMFTGAWLVHFCLKFIPGLSDDDELRDKFDDMNIEENDINGDKMDMSYYFDDDDF